MWWSLYGSKLTNEIMKRVGKRLRLVGARVVGMKGGDACVAHGGRDYATREQDEGDASVPSHRIHHSRPYGYEAAFEAT